MNNNEALNDINDDISTEQKISISEFTSGNNYENSTEKYRDNMSSAITFLICGAAGCIILILNLLGILNFLSYKGASGLLTFIILGGMFIAFIVIGILSLKAAYKAKANIANETNINKEVREWLKENITASDVDASYNGEELAEEMKYFNRSEYLKNAVKNNFSNIDDNIIEEITDSYIDEIFSVD